MAYWPIVISGSTCRSYVLFYGDRLVITFSLQKEVSSALHEAHQGVTKTLQGVIALFWQVCEWMDDQYLECESCKGVEQERQKKRAFTTKVCARYSISKSRDGHVSSTGEWFSDCGLSDKWPVGKYLLITTTKAASLALRQASMTLSSF